MEKQVIRMFLLTLVAVMAALNVKADGDCTDVTTLLANPDFDDATMTNSAPAGWTLDAQTTLQSKISTAAKGNGEIAASQNHWQLWSSTGGMQAEAYQTLTGLENGKYVIVATCCPTVTSGVTLFAGSGTQEVTGNGTFEAVGIVYDGTLRVGLKVDVASGSVTVDFDAFHLYYYGVDADTYEALLTERVGEAKTLVATPVGDVSSAALQQAIDTANALLEKDDATTDELAAALSSLDTAISDYNAAVDAYQTYQTLLDELNGTIADAEAFLAQNDYPGRTDFQQAIDAARALTTATERPTSEELANAGYTLRKAQSDYYASQFTEEAVDQTISTVDTSLKGSEKFVLRIDGKPYYGTEVQVRFDKLYGYNGWTDEEMEVVAAQAAKDGFNTLSVPVFWREVEPEKDRFDWQILDKYMGWCKKYGMKMELLWFSWSSGGRIQYLMNYNGVQTLRTPDYVCSLDGHSDYSMLRPTMEYSLDWRDTNLRDREAYVVSQVMEHIAKWEAHCGQPHIVVGMQLGNEARGYYGNTATSTEIINYHNVIGRAVKQSKHRIWTRMNSVCSDTNGYITANENLRSSEGTNIDFVGTDIYTFDADMIKGNCWGYLPENGKNFRMIMEIDALNASTPLYQLTALYGNKAFDYYNYCVVDGNALYGNDGHTITERDHIGLVRQRNKILNLANQDVATLKQGTSLYVYNADGTSTSTEEGLDGISFTPDEASTQAVALQHSTTEVILLATSAGTFTIPSSLEVKSIAFGHTDEDNKWVTEAVASMTTATTFTFQEAGCVRLEVEKTGDDDEPTDIGAYLINGEFDHDSSITNCAPYGWHTSFSSVNTSKISVTAKGDGSVIGADENHWQVWNKTAMEGKMYQTLTGLPVGKYRLTAGLYCTFSGTVNLYAGSNTTSVTSGENAYCTVDFEVTESGQDVEVGLLLSTTGVTDIEMDHVTLAGLTDAQMKVGEAHWGTFIAPFEVAIPSGVTAYTADGIESDNRVQLTEVSRSISANTAVVLYSENEVDETFYGIPLNTKDAYTTGLLTGTLVDTTAPAGSYVLQNQGDVVGFYLVESDNTQHVGANHAYLTLPASTEGVKVVYFDSADMETTIARVQNATSTAACYDLQGRRIAAPTRGIYIIGGRKMVK